MIQCFSLSALSLLLKKGRGTARVLGKSHNYSGCRMVVELHRQNNYGDLMFELVD